MANHTFGPVVIRDTDHRLYRHPDVGSATAEATRLAKNNPGYRFAVYVPILYKVQGGVTTAEISEFIAPIIREATATEREKFWRRFNEEIEQARQRAERENDSYPHADFHVEVEDDDLSF